MANPAPKPKPVPRESKGEFVGRAVRRFVAEGMEYEAAMEKAHRAWKDNYIQSPCQITPKTRRPYSERDWKSSVKEDG